MQAWPPMPVKGAVGLAPCLPGSRNLPFPPPAPHLRAASAAMRSPCARPCSLSRRRILGDAQAWPAEPGSADLVVKPAHRSSGYLTLSFENGLCSLLLTAPLSPRRTTQTVSEPYGALQCPFQLEPALFAYLRGLGAHFLRIHTGIGRSYLQPGISSKSFPGNIK